MTHKSRPTELSPAERRAYASVSREAHVDEREEERTVRALRARGVFGGRIARHRESRTWWRATAVVSAVAAGIVAVVQSARLRVPPANEPRAVNSAAPTDSPGVRPTPPARTTTTSSEKSSLLVWY